MSSEKWLQNAEKAVRSFAKQFGTVYRKTKRQVYASFEIGCFLSLVEFYKSGGFAVSLENLSTTKQGAEFKYLTTPSGNPHNFSFVKVERDARVFHIRQQVRVESHLNEEIRFTPDLVVLPENAELVSTKHSDFAGGKKKFFRVDATQVIAAHECKSLNPFPELLVGFLGMLVAAHSWLGAPNDMTMVVHDGPHLAPTLFVGGTARSLHRKMVEALGKTYPMNTILGLHSGSWNLAANPRLTRIKTPMPSPRLPEGGAP